MKMKYLYQTNKWLVIINTLLFVVPYFGMLFLIILGASQIFMTIIIALNFNKLDISGKAQFITYSILTTIILSLIFIINESIFNLSNDCFIPIIIISVLLAFLHLNITYILYKTKNHETN